MKFLLTFLLLATPALADTAITPGLRTTIQQGGTITTGGSFQSIMAADPDRTSCTIQNTSTHTLYVYFGSTASATTSNAFQVSAGNFFYCTTNVLALTDNVAVSTSTTSDTFVFSYQH